MMHGQQNIKADWEEVGCLRRRQRADLEKERGSMTHLVLHDDDDDDDDDAQRRWWQC